MRHFLQGSNFGFYNRKLKLAFFFFLFKAKNNKNKEKTFLIYKKKIYQ